ncbi:unnamed protein product [Schistosoma margrebowiei]|uniref:Uncharacterized protein n=1 Tax=Schistosoma margrebowiei TaxID=48269 RepID=A0A183MSR0_9TREM|nr:unnamed protein product [Schistosoma margrebowiei]
MAIRHITGGKTEGPDDIPAEALRQDIGHLPDDVRAHGPLDSFSAFTFESYMRQIKDSVRSGFAVAKQAAQRYAERMSFSDRLRISGLTNTTPIGADDVSTKQSNERERPHQFDCGLSQQFPLSSEEELQMLDTVALTHRLLSSSLNEKDLDKLYDIATQGYFHDIRDKMMKRIRRKQDQGAQGELGMAGSPGSPGLDGQSVLSGSPGEPGASGVQGLSGPPGPLGRPGLDGASDARSENGAHGMSGVPGIKGGSGPIGSVGLPGASGTPGHAGPIGPSEIVGPRGPTVSRKK